jgi:hypothetical protein
MDVKTFRDNLFQMNTRRFGKVAEMIIKNMTSTRFSSNIHHDLNTNFGTGTRIEVKFSRVEKKHFREITDFNVLSVIESEGLSVRLFPYGEWHYNNFDCNIQQIKKKEFDVLFYGLMFADRVMIFMATPDQVDERMKYSNKQHKGNEGEGQFHVNQRTLQYHIDNHHFATLSYTDIMNILKR